MSRLQGLVLYADAGLARPMDAIVSPIGPKALSKDAVPVLPEPTNHRARA